MNHMTTWSFPLPKTSQLQAVEQSEKSDCLARCARFTKRATCTRQPQSDGSSEWKIRCPMCTCDGDDQVHHAHLSGIATQIASCGSDNGGRGIDNKNTSDGTRRANSSDCSTRWQKQEIRTFSHTPHAKEKILREMWRTRHEIEQYVRTCSVRLLAPPQPSTGRCNDCLFKKGVKKKKKKTM